MIKRYLKFFAQLIKVNTILAIYILAILFAMLFYILTLFKYQIIDYSNAQKTVEKYKYENKSIHAKRGSIISSDKQKLAFDIEKYAILLDPINIPDDKVDEAVELLKEHLSIDKETLKSQILEKKEKNKRLLSIKEEIDLNSKNILMNSYRKVSRNKWIFFETISKRYLTEGKDFQNIIGYLNSETEAVYGLEKYYDEYLKGTDGIKRVFLPAVNTEELKRATLPYLIDSEILKESEAGNDIHLNIDTVMQFALDDVLQKTYEQYSPVSVMGILMESQTGNIIAMGSYPYSDNKADIKNRNITDLFEPGSIFKPITVAAALQEGLINENTIIHSDGFIKVRDRIIHDHDSTTKGDLTLSQVIASSGNVALVKIGAMLDNSVFYDYLLKFGFNSKTGIDTYFESTSKLFPLKSFSEVRKSNVSFGQGISMTQMQMLNALNTTINGGKLLKPHLVNKITDKSGNIIKENKVEVVTQAIDERISAKIRKMLEGVVLTGTGRKVAIPGYTIGGKTGTAQKAGPGGYQKGKYFSSFFAFLPADNPKYSILITVNEPHGAYYGAAVALPPAREILQKLIKYKGIKPDFIAPKEQTNEVKNNIIKKAKRVNADIEKINNAKIDFENNVMPDLVGISLKDLININPFDKFNIEYTGSGNVINQNIEKGTKIDENTKIKLELR
ncbi:penicillin-binding protein [Oceanivirga salmonicida]|uniref:penicillin-binding protein n=1 Tax=Oceanivirga salmonicida TaxID=1769291 RepID=UPI00082F3093|nr:penicillin-binding protein [Oceanivirga salmonicida]